MLRYYAIATIVVVLIGATITARQWLRGDLKIASVQVRASPRPDVHGADLERDRPGGFRLQSASALSTLPDCVLQTGHVRGARTFVEAHAPGDRMRVPPGTNLTLGACSLVVRGDDILITRGNDRLRVTPDARLYTIRDGYYLEVTAKGALESRFYRRVDARS